MNLDVRTISLFVGALSAVQALSIFAFSQMVGPQSRINQYAYGNAGFSLGFILMLLRGVIPDFFTIVIANTAMSLAGYTIFDGVCTYAKREWDRRPFLLIPAGIFLFFLYFTYSDNDISARTMLISVTSAFFSFLCSFILVKYHEKELRYSSWFTAIILLIYGVFLLIRSVMVAVTPIPESIFINTDLQVISFLLMALCGLLWTIGFAMMMAQRLLVDVKRVAVTDYLTGILNRKAGQEALEQEIEKGRKELRPFSILMVDIDHFKTVNDVYGHAGGDIALQRIAWALKAKLRSQDTLCRWGGEEFLIVLPGVGQRDAYNIAERTRRRIAEIKIAYQEWRIKCTVSIGVSGSWGESVSVDEILARADRSLYEAKTGGRNRVVLFGQPWNRVKKDVVR